MFNIGNLILYSTHGICRIDDICEKKVLGATKSYYILHPMEDCKLTISIPVDNDKVIMLELLNREEAEESLESFKISGIDWIEENNERNRVYSEMVRNGNRKEISMIANTLMRKKIIVKCNGEKFHEKDKKLLTSIQSMLFTELAFSLETTFETVYEEILSYIKENKCL